MIFVCRRMDYMYVICCIYIVWRLNRMVPNVMLVNTGLCVPPARFNDLNIWMHYLHIITQPNTDWVLDHRLYYQHCCNILRLKFSPGKIYHVIWMLSLVSLTGSCTAGLVAFLNICLGTKSEKRDWLLSPHRSGCDTKPGLLVLGFFIIGERTFLWLHEFTNEVFEQHVTVHTRK